MSPAGMNPRPWKRHHHQRFERRTVVPLQPSKWTEPDGTIVTTGRLSEAHVPVLVTQRAVALGNAVLPILPHISGCVRPSRRISESIASVIASGLISASPRQHNRKNHTPTHRRCIPNSCRQDVP
jgi:hypothetical protein